MTVHTENPGFESIDEIKQAVADNGGHFFDDDTIEFFDSRIESDVIGGEFFITSEQRDPLPSELRRGADSEHRRYSRLYTIRRADRSGEIYTVGEFQEFDTEADARDEIQRIMHNELESTKLPDERDYK